LDKPISHLARIFKDAATHREVAGVIGRHLDNSQDIRKVALEGLNLAGAREILDLGCGFGFFTEGLQDKVSPLARITGIDCHPEYEWFFFQACEKINIRKRFSSSGCTSVKSMKAQSFDLILCSYALYFFPEMISEIARVLSKNGTFISITHTTGHFHQFSELVRDILSSIGIKYSGENDYEKLIDRFSDMNGREMLKEGFQTITEKQFSSTLVFTKEDYDDFVTYFDFKHEFFLPEMEDRDLYNLVLKGVKEYLVEGNKLEISKDDIIYICADPR